MKNRSIFLILSIIILLSPFINSCNSCKRNASPKKAIRPTFSTYRSYTTGRSDENGKKEIFYGLLTPTQVTEMFNRLGVPHDNAILNPTSNRDLYTTNAKASLNLGIYGVDFGYIKIFGIGQQMINYIMTIRDISNKLDIPENYLMDPIEKLESDSSNPDSVMALVNKSYNQIETHLRKEGRESTAGLMLMGGWVEAMYITTQLLLNPEDPDKEIVERIAQQKYTLTSLLSFMKNYYDDPVVVFYTKKLIYLKRFFDTFEIYYKIGDLRIDTTHQVLLATGSETTISLKTLNNIRNYVAKLRTEMVTP